MCASFSSSARRVRSPYFEIHCQVTQDVLFEARGHPHHAILEGLVTQVTPGVLAQLQLVMGREPVGDTKLVDLYRNKGSADPGLVAWLLDNEIANSDKLYAESWRLVTDDVALASRAAGFGLKVIGSSVLAELIDQSPAAQASAAE